MSFAQKIKRAMAQKPITMEQLKQILQLSLEGVAIREIARRTDVCRNSVRKYLHQFDDITECLYWNYSS